MTMPAPKPKPAEVPFMPRGSAIRLMATAAFCALALYLVVFWNPAVEIQQGTIGEPEAPLVSVPHIDSAVLDKAKDATREQRLFLEAEPLSHLLAQSLNVSPEAARALGMPADMVPITALQTNIGEWRGRWIYYRGKIEQLAGPRPGHPVPGYGIYEATLRLRDGSLVLFTFSKAPEADVVEGAWARAEGYVLKLRDVAHPTESAKTPLLVGAELKKDYEDWAPVTTLDPNALAKVDDVVREGADVLSSEDSWKAIDEDQSSALWHLGAYARDVAPMTKAEWRKVPALNAQDIWEAFKKNEVARGTPMRIQQLGSSLELNAYYFRRYSYETRNGKQMWTPLFVANSLDLFVFETGRGMREISSWAFGGTVLIALFAWWGARREKQRSAAQEDALIERRRKRRRTAANTAPQT